MGRGSVLLKPHIPDVHFFQMWKEKFFDHLPVSSCIHRDSALVFLKKIRTNDPDRRNCAPNGNTLTMERGLVKLTWIFSTSVAHVLFVDTARKVKVSLVAEERYRVVGKGFKESFTCSVAGHEIAVSQQPVCTDKIRVRCEGFVSQFGQKASEQSHDCEQNGGGTAKMTHSLNISRSPGRSYSS